MGDSQAHSGVAGAGVGLLDFWARCQGGLLSLATYRPWPAHSSTRFGLLSLVNMIVFETLQPVLENWRGFTLFTKGGL